MAMTMDGTQLPESVKVGGTPRITPNELRLLKAATGKALEQLFSDEADAMQSMVWLRLRREGFQVSWEQAGDVAADMTPDAVDPTNSGS